MHELDPNRTPGKDFPIPCKYEFTATGIGEQPKATTPKFDTPIPEGWSEEWIYHDDPRVQEYGFTPAPLWYDEATQQAGFEWSPGAKPLAVRYLLDEEGALVATWDEGRWWTPEESDQFVAMIGGRVRPDDLKINESFWGYGTTEVVRDWLKDNYDPKTMPTLRVASLKDREEEGLYLMGWDHDGYDVPPLLEMIFGPGYAAHRLDQVKADIDMTERIANSDRGEYGKGAT